MTTRRESRWLATRRVAHQPSVAVGRPGRATRALPAPWVAPGGATENGGCVGVGPVLPAAGGPQLVAVVQPDGSVAWVPATSIPADAASPPHQQHHGHGQAHGPGHHPQHGTSAYPGTPPAGGTPALSSGTPPAATPPHRRHNQG